MAIQDETAELATVVEETVAGVRVVKGFGAESVQPREARDEADDVYEISMRATRCALATCRRSSSCRTSARSSCCGTAATWCSTAI